MSWEHCCSWLTSGPLTGPTLEEEFKFFIQLAQKSGHKIENLTECVPPCPSLKGYYVSHVTAGLWPQL